MEKEITLVVTTVDGEDYRYTGESAKEAYKDICACMDSGRIATKELKDASDYMTRFVVSNIISTFYREK